MNNSKAQNIPLRIAADNTPDHTEVAAALQRIEDATDGLHIAIFDLGVLYYDQTDTIATTDDSTPANDNAHNNVETIESHLKNLNADQLRWYIKGLNYCIHRHLT